MIEGREIKPRAEDLRAILRKDQASVRVPGIDDLLKGILCLDFHRSKAHADAITGFHPSLTGA